MAARLDHAAAAQPCPGPAHDDLRTAIAAACARVAPLWPLPEFVAVNPFVGYADQSYGATCAELLRIAGLRALPSRQDYLAALGEGRITDRDLDEARARLPASWPLPADPAEVRARLVAAPRASAGAAVATVAEVLDQLASGDRQASHTAFMIDEISRFCATYFDRREAPSTALPDATASPYAAWREAMRHDRSAEYLGIHGFRRIVAALPATAVETIAVVVEALGIPPPAREDYLHRALLDINGWASYARHFAWRDGRCGTGGDPSLLEGLLAIRVAFGYALFESRDDVALREAWATARDRAILAAPHAGAQTLALDLWLQEAYEWGYQRPLLERLTAAKAAAASAERPPAQAYFCIDVRSEVYRRSLEAAWPAAQTGGFAGFFGFAIDYLAQGARAPQARCPVLIAPQLAVSDRLSGTSPGEQAAIAGRSAARRGLAQAWAGFRDAAVGSFTFVETAGPLYALKLLRASAGGDRPPPDPPVDGLDRADRARLVPALGAPAGQSGLPQADLAARARCAEGALRGMSLTRGFARLVLLCGHAGASVNNPHARGLDCGACGGHSGEINARVAAAVLNEPGVRAELLRRGIEIPSDTWFVAGLHVTTTDEVVLLDLEHLPASHRDDVARLSVALHRASRLARRERAPALGEGGRADPRTALARRARDWSQVRPEWGLAGNAAFIAAPRARTRGIDLGGRAFLHCYDWRQDPEFAVLELIMTAPMVVAAWINLQYYASVVDNRFYGSGNKTLHNVVGRIGVLEGNGGDLRVGLPLQSVHDGERWIHEPLRLCAVIEAPREAIGRVLERHAHVRDLVAHRWLHLYALDGDLPAQRYAGLGRWETLP